MNELINDLNNEIQAYWYYLKQDDSHAIISNIAVKDFKILPHVKGNRLVNQPIFERKFYKPISKRMLDRTLKLFKNDLIKYK